MVWPRNAVLGLPGDFEERLREPGEGGRADRRGEDLITPRAPSEMAHRKGGQTQQFYWFTSSSDWGRKLLTEI